jgi:hypothetical protein
MPLRKLMRLCAEFPVSLPFLGGLPSLDPDELFQFQIFGSLGGGGHDFFLSLPYCRNGMPICFSRAIPSASVRAEVVMEIFIPLVFSTLA